MTFEALAKKIDHTLLRPNATPSEVQKAVEYARAIGAATACVNPCYVSLAAALLDGCDTDVCTVIGFPLGAATTRAKAFEAEDAWKRGAKELDMVLNIGAAKAGDWRSVEKDIAAVVGATPGLVKVILETGFLTHEEISAACKAAMAAGAAWVKTSTGFGPRGASVEDVASMRRTVGGNAKVKAAGGMQNLAEALAMLNAGADRLGTSRTMQILGEL